MSGNTGFPSRRAAPLRIDDGDSFDLDHEIGTGEAGYADGRAGWGGHAKIAHADIATFLKFVEISDEGIGLHDVGPNRTGRLEALVEVFERLFHLARMSPLPTQLPSISRASWPAV